MSGARVCACDTPLMAKRPARPRDPMQLAKLIGDIATGEAPNERPAPVREGQRKGGLKGGKSRANKLSEARRKAIAKQAAATRWSKRCS